MAKKQTFADKVEKVKAAGAAHCPVCDEVPVATKVREYVSEGGRMRLTQKMVKVCKCNSANHFG
jgi:hypothetical protein